MHNLTGRVLRAADPGWADAVQGFALNADYANNVPKNVVFCEDAEDVRNAVRYAKANKVPFRVRSGRHNYEGYSSLVKDGLIIDVSDINFVRLNPDRTIAEIGAGCDMLQLFEILGACGVTLPLATGPSVGIAGLTMGGGVGVTSRLWGLTCDNLVEVELVTADGEVVRANEKERADLFWALRGGGGGNFGAVTSFKFKVHPVNNVAIFTLSYDWQAFPAVVAKWQDWAFQADNRITTLLQLLTTQQINLQGQFTASDTDLAGIQSLLGPMLDPSLGLTSVNIQILPAVFANRVMLGVDPMQPAWRVDVHTDDEMFKSTSAFCTSPLPPEGISALLQGLDSPPQLSAPPMQPSMVQLLGGGGAVNVPKPTDTAVFYRDVRFVVQYDAYWSAPEDADPTITWIENLRSNMSPYTLGAYANYTDHLISDYLTAYFGGNLARLVEVKAKYDPDNLFQFPQSIPTSMPGAQK
jgi:FAD/FMN-containing dehydrogenase